jgi:ParB-like chromosome segregation protein Spo0J
MNRKKLKRNPKNPRLISEPAFKKLVKSLKEFPQMMDLRPIIVDEEGVVLGGNMRLQALIELGYTKFPETWVKVAEGLTEEQKREFIIKDNASFGEWDWDMLANEWDELPLSDWSIELPDIQLGMAMPDEQEQTEKKADATICPKCGHEFD